MVVTGFVCGVGAGSVSRSGAGCVDGFLGLGLGPSNGRRQNALRVTRCPRARGAARSRVADAGGMTMLFDSLAGQMSETMRKLQGSDKLTEKNVESSVKEVRRALLDADVNLKVVNSLIKDVKARALGEKVLEGVKPGQQFIKIIYDELARIMGSEATPLARKDASAESPTVILLAGLQGAGKTTAAAKLALYCKSEAKPRRVLLCACDVYRPAAIEQLKTLGASIDTEVFAMGTDVEPERIAREAISYAKKNKFDTVIVDTAGRQVIDTKLMAELKRVKNSVTPDEILLVVDAMTGQEAANLTRAFNDAVGITGAILTKLDGDTRGGAALSVKQVSGRPIKFVGVGEKVEKLEPFYPERMASRILGMGDVLSFVEKAQEQMDEAEARRLTQKMVEAKFDFEDFVKQTEMITKMGSLGGMMKMIPGMAGISDAQLTAAERQLKLARSLINSMTRSERRNPDLLIKDRTARSRLQRIAAGSGRSSKDASQLISDFQRMRTMMARMGKTMMDGGPGAAAPAGMGGMPGMAGGTNRSARRKEGKKKQASKPTGKGFGRP
ncbi:Signal recognition particle protein [Porphyridium purpureum]|uniref:signal-recognition-particle GTPase n=1 Tax=Porphyridium purpureum TaxID=35688 RepID=A0A5J4YVF1_PORPP|nr:Signal recognition particle protein [Porphyridium purpureum]|eukprot:POR0031..scf227_4